MVSSPRTEVVANIIKDTEHEDVMIEMLLEFKAFCEGALHTAFVDPQTKQPNPKFLTDAFTYGFKARKNKPAELLAKHLDRLMRRGQRDTSDVYRQQGRVQDHRALSTLLLERSASDDYEKAMLTKLKEDYDPELRMGDHMFSDLAPSRDLLYEYRKRMSIYRSGRKPVWQMQSELAAYVAFYKSKHQGHKLDWDHSIGTATLKARFSSATKELTVSLYQTVVLLLFNEPVELGCKQILEATRMDSLFFYAALYRSSAY
ncbi:hypothetical protein EDC04DRAFT_2909505 [Pisolithus marmoratus]|nr:hypothetical protein EDC04DRAFT_2909505 [Pisolithus marmoratus]